MAGMTVRCAGGHENSAGQKFCGECGASLAGLCPNGHPTADGQKFCSECGVPLNLGAAAEPVTSTPPSSEPDRTERDVSPLRSTPSSFGNATEHAHQQEETAGSPTQTHVAAGGSQQPPQYSPPRENNTGSTPSRRKLFIGLAGVAALIIAIIFFSSFSKEERWYLDALKNPCQHPEVYSNPQSAGCSFDWLATDSELVKEGHKICELEGNKPNENYAVARDYVWNRHLTYRLVQVNTELIAAEKLLC